jgi:hypothetical protein
MALVWLVECKTCLLRFAVKPREATPGKSTEQLVPGAPPVRRECPHCHEVHDYTSQDYIPGEGRVR